MVRFFAGIICLLVLAGVSSSVQAVPYGRGSYSECALQTGCANPSPVPNPVPQPETPVGDDNSEFTVVVNLEDGQQVSPIGYVVTVKPQNGVQLESVDFYLDDTLMHTAIPETDGTAAWHWDTSNQPGTRVRIVARDTLGRTVERTFTVGVARPTPSSPNQPPPEAADKPLLLQILPQGVAEQLERTVRRLPPLAAEGFPYLIFSILGLGLVLLALNARRELAYLRTSRATLERELMLKEEKDTFLQLLAHYLRTPLTLMRAVVDSPDRDSSPAVRPQLTAAVNDLATKVEQVIERLNGDKVLAAVGGLSQAAGNVRVWLVPGFWVPVCLMLLFIWFFNYLVIQVGQFDVGSINVLTQVIGVLILAVGFYVVVRGRKLRQLQRESIEEHLRHQAAVDVARTGTIRLCIDSLTEDLDRIRDLLPQLGAGQLGATMRTSYERYQKVMEVFGLVSQLQAGHSQAAFTPLQFSELVNQAITSEQAAATAKGIVIKTGADITLASQRPDWLVHVLRTVVNNAIAYSPQGGTVEITAASEADSTVVVSVTDHGKGISKDRVELLFQPFFRAEGALDFSHEGIGLSLYVDKLIMSYLGGTIAVRSQPSRGTVVRLVFPIDRQI